jgi:transcriptional regulator GlxA family with amidase domain
LLSLAKAWFDALASEERLLSLRVSMTQVLLELRRALASPQAVMPAASSPRLQSQKLRRVLDEIAARAHEPVTQPEIARLVGMSTSRLRAFFKKTTGWGFAQYLRELRVERAAKLLRDSADSVASIAHQTGFADQSHLLRCFRLKHGCAPLAYRRLHQSGS